MGQTTVERRPAIIRIVVDGRSDMEEKRCCYGTSG